MPWLLAWVLSLASAQSFGQDRLGDPYVSERFHISMRPPLGWKLANSGLVGDEPVEFWKDNQHGPRIQIYAFPFELEHPSDLVEAQRELSSALRARFPSLEISSERLLTHRGDPAIEVMASLEIDNTYYHVLQRCLFGWGRIYIITCASFESSFLEELPLFRNCLESVELLANIHDPSREGHSLIPGTALVYTAVGILVSGVFLRRVSVSRLKRVNR